MKGFWLYSVLKDARKGGRPSKSFGSLLGVSKTQKPNLQSWERGWKNSLTGAFHLSQDSWDSLTSASRPELGLNKQKLTFWHQAGERNVDKERTSQFYLKTCKLDMTLTSWTKRRLGQTIPTFKITKLSESNFRQINGTTINMFHIGLQVVNYNHGQLNLHFKNFHVVHGTPGK